MRINFTLSDGYTPLIWASNRGYNKCVSNLLKEKVK